MELKNGYKVLYDKVDGEERVILASKTESPEGAEEILRATIGEYKLIYQNAEGKICGSVTGIPATDDKVFTEFDTVFVETTSEEETPELDQGEEPEVENPVVEPEIPTNPEVENTEEELTENPIEE